MLTDKTLQELDGVDWGEPDVPWTLVIDCHRLRRVPLKDFTDGDLSRMLRQKFSLDYLVPIAVARLLDEPFAGDMGDGELMRAVTNVPSAFWQGHPDLAKGFDAAVANALVNARDILQNEEDQPVFIDEETLDFLQNYQPKYTITRSGETQTL